MQTIFNISKQPAVWQPFIGGNGYVNMFTVEANDTDDKGFKRGNGIGGWQTKNIQNALASTQKVEVCYFNTHGAKAN